METAQYFDVLIIGAGMIGSAAARHLTSISPDLKICLVGPKERKGIRGRHGIYGSYYDEGRIIRSLDAGPMWTELGRRSITRFKELEQRTGIMFYREVGHVTWTRRADPYIEKVKENARAMKVNLQELGKREMEQKYPFLSMKSHEEAILQTTDAGYVSPRAQVLAQQAAAKLNGCRIVDDVIDQVTETNQSDGSKYMTATTAKGQILHARKVLLCTGAFTGFRDLLPEGTELDVRLSGATLLFAELSDKDALKLQDMPCIIYKENKTKDKYDCYVLPPIQYPDGKYYLKIGHRTLYKKELHTASEVDDWFQNQRDKSALKPLEQILLGLIKGVKPVSIHGVNCILTYTPSLLPYCDMVTSSLAVAIGGNGVGAKVADEVGRMAAKMVFAGHWNHDLPHDKFRVRLKKKPKVNAKL